MGIVSVDATVQAMLDSECLKTLLAIGLPESRKGALVDAVVSHPQAPSFPQLPRGMAATVWLLIPLQTLPSPRTAPESHPRLQQTAYKNGQGNGDLRQLQRAIPALKLLGGPSQIFLSLYHGLTSPSTQFYPLHCYTEINTGSTSQ